MTTERYGYDLKRMLKGTNTNIFKLNANPRLSDIRFGKSTVDIKGGRILTEKLNQGNQLASGEPGLFELLSSNNRVMSTTGSGRNTIGGWRKGAGKLATEIFEGRGHVQKSVSTCRASDTLSRSRGWGCRLAGPLVCDRFNLSIIVGRVRNIRRESPSSWLGCSGMKNIGAGCTRRHNVSEFAQVDPASIPKWLGLGMFLDVVIPRRCSFGRDTGTRFIIPVPSADCLDGNNGAVDFTECGPFILAGLDIFRTIICAVRGNVLNSALERGLLEIASITCF